MRAYSVLQLPLLDAKHVVHTEFVYADLVAGQVRYNTSQWDIDWGGFTWLKAGTLLRIEWPDEDLTLAANPLTIYLSGVTPTMTSLGLSTPVNGYPLSIWHGLFNTSTYQLVGTPVLDFSGRLSNITLINASNENG